MLTLYPTLTSLQDSRWPLSVFCFWDRTDGSVGRSRSRRHRMLTAAEALHVERRRRPRPSLRQQYDEYILQRIESYKNSVARNELLRLGEEAATELLASAEGQFVLTEVLMVDYVDDLIKRRLKLKSYRQWRQYVKSLRDAQRQPTHWGLEPDCAVVGLLRRIEPDDHAVVVGPSAESIACLLAAHDMAVTFMAGDLGTVDRIESRFESEALTASFVAYVVDFGRWLPPVADAVAMTVLDAGTLGELDSATCADLVRALKARTACHGLHVLLPGTSGLKPEALLSLYDGWSREKVGKPRRRTTPSRGIILTKPDTEPCDLQGDLVAS